MAKLFTIQASLDALDEPYHLLSLSGGANLCVTQHGGRIIGIFPSADSDNLLWTNADAIGNPDSFRKFIANGEWNLGGERVWIAPELQYNIKDRQNFWGTHAIPPQMDPGDYVLEKISDTFCRLTQAIELRAYNLAEGTKQLNIERDIRSDILDPLRHLPDYNSLIGDIHYFGYEQTVSLSEQNDTSIISESWNLVQLNAGGTLTIPCHHATTATTYFGHVADDAQTATDGAMRIHITGQQQYKVGYKSASTGNRMGYLNKLSEAESYLLVRHFDNNPSAHYTEQPPDAIGNSGHSIHVYNDGGEFGGNGEMECNGQGMGGPTLRKQSVDTFTMWCYVGDEDKLRAIGSILLGVEL